MPFHWWIDSREALVRGTAEGPVTLGDVQQYLRAIEGAEAYSYRKIIDLRDGTLGMTAEELTLLVFRIRQYHGVARMGALAIVCSAEQSVRINRLLGALATADRPMKMFTSSLAAAAWIEQQT